MEWNGAGALLLITAFSVVMGCGQPERDWQDEVLYFALIDRLANGDPTNDDQGHGEWDASRESHFHGGDLKGVLEVLGGIQALGVTGIWLTPPVRNQWWNPERTYTGYHGYWASDFEAVDPHFGTLEDWQAVAAGIHEQGMRLIQDVVVNHTGDWVLTGPTGSVVRDHPVAEWLQPDSNRYHFQPAIADYSNPDQILTHELAGLDDLRTEDEAVRDKLREVFRWWIEVGGADGFRFDTHKYVEREFWPAFLEGKGESMGVRQFAERKGADFPTFGEIWVHSAPFTDAGEREMLTYLRRPGYEGVDAVLNFPLQETLLRVFGEGAKGADLAHRLQVQNQIFPDPARQLVNFIDNHDMARFRATASEPATRQALNSLLSLPGVPVIYQGTEQGDVEPRPNLFGRFDITSEPFVWLQEAIAWRRAHPAVRRGRVVTARALEGTPLIHWAVADGPDTVFVLCNASDDRVFASEVPSSRANRAPIPTREQGRAEVAFAGQDLAFAILEPRTWMAWSEWSPSASLDAAGDSLILLNGRVASSGLEKAGNGVHRVQVARTDAEGRVVAMEAPEQMEVRHPQQSLGMVVDACGDDRGLSGQISPPTSPGFAHSMDLHSLEVIQEGPEWELRLRMCGDEWSTVWGPRFGFDHVAFEVQIARGDSLYARWRHTGWTLQPLKGATPQSDGAHNRGDLAWRIPAPTSGGWVVTVDSWDADGNGQWRPLNSTPGPYEMGSHVPESERVMDRIIWHESSLK